jgi:hypothetical protein
MMTVFQRDIWRTHVSKRGLSGLVTGVSIAMLRLGIQPAAAQVPAEPVPPLENCTFGIQTDLSVLTQAFRGGQWTCAPNGSCLVRFAEQLRADLASRGCAATDAHLLLVWYGRDPVGPRLFSYAWPTSTPFATRVPGIAGAQKQLIEVFLSERPGEQMKSVYVSTETADPLQAQLTQAATTYAATFFTGIAGAEGPIRPPTPPLTLAAEKAPTTVVLARELVLPFKRADIKVARRASIPLNQSEFNEKVAGVEQQALVIEGRGSAIATALAQLLAKTAIANFTHACLGEQIASCRANLSASLAKVFEEHRDSGSALDVELMAKVDSRFREFVASLAPALVAEDTSLTNEPLTRFGIGVVAGYIHSAKPADPRVKVGGNGMLVEDPLPRGLAAAVLNYVPWGYDRKTVRPSKREQLRIFVGPVFTPNIGLAVGAGWQPIRFVSIVAGIGRLWYPTGAIGSTPATGSGPFEQRSVGIKFSGVAVNWQ